jgi:hypothetical protein
MKTIHLSRPLLLATCLFAILPPVHADNLAELVSRQIEAKDAEAKAKGVLPSYQGQGAPAALAAMPAGMPPGQPTDPTGAILAGADNDIRADDIQLIGVYGVSDDLKALVCVKVSACSRDTALTVVKGQHLRDWTVASLTPDVALFERPRKGRGKKAQPERREIYLSTGVAPVSGASLGAGLAGQSVQRGAMPTPLVLPPQPMH